MDHTLFLLNKWCVVSALKWRTRSIICYLFLSLNFVRGSPTYGAVISVLVVFALVRRVLFIHLFGQLFCQSAPTKWALYALGRQGSKLKTKLKRKGVDEDTVLAFKGHGIKERPGNVLSLEPQYPSTAFSKQTSAPSTCCTQGSFQTLKPWHSNRCSFPFQAYHVSHELHASHAGPPVVAQTFPLLKLFLHLDLFPSYFLVKAHPFLHCIFFPCICFRSSVFPELRPSVISYVQSISDQLFVYIFVIIH